MLYQLAALDGIARACGSRVSYVKPHGALYNAVVDHEAQAQAVVDAVGRLRRRGCRSSGCPGSALLRAAEAAGLRTVARGLRRPRLHRRPARWCRAREPGALVHDPAAVADRAVRMAVDGEVVAVDGTRGARSTVESVCVHGDTPGAVELARAVRAALEAAGLHAGTLRRLTGLSRPPAEPAGPPPAARPESRSSATSSTVRPVAVGVGAEQVQGARVRRPRGRR